MCEIYRRPLRIGEICVRSPLDEQASRVDADEEGWLDDNLSPPYTQMKRTSIHTLIYFRNAVIRHALHERMRRADNDVMNNPIHHHSSDILA